MPNRHRLTAGTAAFGIRRTSRCGTCSRQSRPVLAAHRRPPGTVSRPTPHYAPGFPLPPEHYVTVTQWGGRAGKMNSVLAHPNPLRCCGAEASLLPSA
jgi:hypothetical protein